MKQLLVGLIAIGTAAVLTAQVPLGAARDLYASGAYEEALATLTRAHDSNTAPTAIEQIDQYRAFCLFALGRTSEAQLVAADLIAKNPMMQLDITDVSPRIAAMFAEVRKRLLPGLVRERYGSVRKALDSNDFVAAEPQLAEVRRMLDEVERVGAMDDALADLRVLVDGFLRLARSSQEKAPAPLVPQPSSPAAPETAARRPASPAPRIFDGASEVTAPAIIRQDIPLIPESIRAMVQSGPGTGLLELVIDEQGNVERSAMRQSINPAYDGLVLRASKSWRYRPAMNGDTPVKYLKIITIVVQK